MDYLTKLMELLEGMSIDGLRLVLHFAEFLKSVSWLTGSRARRDRLSTAVVGKGKI